MRSKELGDRKPVTLNLFRVISQKIGKREIQKIEFKRDEPFFSEVSQIF